MIYQLHLNLYLNSFSYNLNILDHHLHSLTFGVLALFLIVYFVCLFVHMAWHGCGGHRTT